MVRTLLLAVLLLLLFAAVGQAATGVALDRSYGAAPVELTSVVDGVRVEGHVLLGGTDGPRPAVVRLGADGSPDEAFAPDLAAYGVTAVTALQESSDGRVLVGGQAGETGIVLRVAPTGAIEIATKITTGPDAEGARGVRDLDVLPSGEVLALLPGLAIVRLTPDLVEVERHDGQGSVPIRSSVAFAVSGAGTRAALGTGEIANQRTGLSSYGLLTRPAGPGAPVLVRESFVPAASAPDGEGAVVVGRQGCFPLPLHVNQRWFAPSAA